MASHEVVIFGASGYSGLELLRLLARHPNIEVVGASSDSSRGERVFSRLPEWPSDLVFEPHDDLMRRVTRAQTALLATPAKTSAELVKLLFDRGVSVVDLSGAYRLQDPRAYVDWYGFAHPYPELLAKAEYGLIELNDRRVRPQTPRIIANPGCYATAAILASLPLVVANLIDNSPIVIDGKSGVTGAGKTLDEKLLFGEVAESVRPYRVARHQHTPEIERALSFVAKRQVVVSFTAHLIPMRRGLLTSVYARARSGVRQEEVDRALTDMYAAGRFVRVVRDRPPETGILTGSNFAEVGAVLDERTRTLIAFAALDNLVKGAAGQAIQNLNRLLGFEPNAGLLPERFEQRNAGSPA
jgi:N-acetyl-gamma-glutamyl-phosphate reductase